MMLNEEKDRLFIGLKRVVNLLDHEFSKNFIR